MVHLRVTSLSSFSIFFFFFEKLFLRFNCRCFLLGRCSMEMWCPDDIGRDSWVGLGHLLDSTLQSGVEAPCLLKRSLPHAHY